MKKIKRHIQRATLLCIALLALNCQNEEPTEIPIQSNIKTVSIDEAKKFLINSKNNAFSKSSNNELENLQFDKISQEEIKGSHQLFTIIPFSTNNELQNDRILLIKSDNEIKSVIFSMYPEGKFNNEAFSGKIFIYSLDGEFINGYKAKDGIIISQFVKSNIKTSVTAKNKQDGGGTAIQLDEVPVKGIKRVDAFKYDMIMGGGGSAPSGGGSGGNQGMSWNSGAGGGGSSTPTTSTTDPCNTAKTITADTKSDAYLSAKNDIVKGNNDGLEHSITLGKDANGNINQAPMNSGGPNNVKVNTTWAGAFGAMHNHPSNTPLSAGDIYASIVLNTSNSNFTTSFIVTSGETYAIVVTDLAAAQAFTASYPADVVPGYNPEFPDAIFLQIEKAKDNLGYSVEGRTKAIASILSKYNAGITLLKQDSNGEFSPLIVKETTQSNGVKTYTEIPCN